MIDEPAWCVKPVMPKSRPTSYCQALQVREKADALNQGKMQPWVALSINIEQTEALSIAHALSGFQWLVLGAPGRQKGYHLALHNNRQVLVSSQLHLA